VVAAAWAGACVIRFHTDLLPASQATPPLRDYVLIGAATLPLFYALLRYRGLYEPRRGLSRSIEARTLLEVTTIGTLLLAALTFFWREQALSRPTMLVFWALGSAGLVTFRFALRVVLGEVRRRGFNMRSVLIVGTGELARQVFLRFQDHTESGFQVIGFVGPSKTGLGDSAQTGSLGSYEELRSVVVNHAVDHVVIALDRAEPVDTAKLVGELDDTTAAVRIVPDLLGLRTVRPHSEDFDGLPMICLVETPMLGWDEVIKRASDILLSSLGLIVLSPLMAIIALTIRRTSPGAPALFRQERMSLDGRLFTMLKFRTMIPNAEAETGPTWAVKDDPRRTRLGAQLRRLNLDELPQLWNVLRGDMSMVGPRPERPEFIDDFRRAIEGYILRHKVKGGLTGWAQVHGLRGNTSIEKRLEYDLEYARRWSLWFDLRILGLTLIRAFRDPNAY
jgi:exopolysaccharide biosynthesis polyprenyl glycosylphosphotransferase